MQYWLKRHHNKIFFFVTAGSTQLIEEEEQKQERFQVHGLLPFDILPFGLLSIFYRRHLVLSFQLPVINQTCVMFGTTEKSAVVGSQEERRFLILLSISLYRKKRIVAAKLDWPVC